MPYKDGEVVIVQVDPFHQTTGLLFPAILQRILGFSNTHYSEINPLAQARDIGMRACMGDPNLLLLAFLAPEGRMIGHAVSTVQETYGRRWLFVTQCKVDESAGDVVQRAIQMGEEFGRAHGADILIFETRRSDSAWAKAYGFKTMRHLMAESLNGKELTSVDAEPVRSVSG